MLLHRGELDARSLADIESARDLFEPYCFSMRMGVEGDAGYQASYHGLKGRISDDFIALGEKHLTDAGSSSEDTGEGPFYLLTHIRLAEDCDVCFDTGAIPPESFWLDGAEVVPERTRLSQGLHTLLIKYPHGLRTRFVAVSYTHLDVYKRQERHPAIAVPAPGAELGLDNAIHYAFGLYDPPVSRGLGRIHRLKQVSHMGYIRAVVPEHSCV